MEVTTSFLPLNHFRYILMLQEKGMELARGVFAFGIRVPRKSRNGFEVCPLFPVCEKHIIRIPQWVKNKPQKMSHFLKF